MKKEQIPFLQDLAIGNAVLVFINAHFRQQVYSSYSMSDYRFLLLFVMLMPMAAAALLSIKGRRYGLILLSICSNVLQKPPSPWRIASRSLTPAANTSGVRTARTICSARRRFIRCRWLPARTITSCTRSSPACAGRGQEAYDASFLAEVQGWPHGGSA